MLINEVPTEDGTDPGDMVSEARRQLHECENEIAKVEMSYHGNYDVLAGIRSQLEKIFEMVSEFAQSRRPQSGKVARQSYERERKRLHHILHDNVLRNYQENGIVNDSAMGTTASPHPYALSMPEPISNQCSFRYEASTLSVPEPGSCPALDYVDGKRYNLINAAFPLSAPEEILIPPLARLTLNAKRGI